MLLGWIGPVYVIDVGVALFHKGSCDSKMADITVLTCSITGYNDCKCYDEYGVSV